MAAPVVAWTTGMKTPRTSTVTSTEAMAAKDGIAFREIERNASLTKKAGFMMVDYSLGKMASKSPVSASRWVRARRGSGDGSRSSAPNSAVLMSVGAS